MPKEKQTHKPSTRLRFVRRSEEGRVKLILQQHWFPIDWDEHTDYWADVPIEEET